MYSIINGSAGVGYIIAAEFEISLQSINDKDERWERQELENKVKLSPRNDLAALELIIQSKYGKFGFFLIFVALVQFIAGLLFIFLRSLEFKTAIFLCFTSILGMIVEILSANISSQWGIINISGLIVSIILIIMTYYFYALSATDTINDD